MIQFSRFKHKITRRTINPPLGFVHIPKAAGTSITQQLDLCLRPRKFIYGLDRSQFGSFTAFETMPAEMRAGIFDRADAIPEQADIIAGHLSPKTIRAHYPSARLITIMRAPSSRLVSHWFYWRGYTDDVLTKYGTWGNSIAIARSDFADFLCAQQIACVTDNVILRMLLWPHPLIPDNNFIDPKHDTVLLAEARLTLDHFCYTDIVEAPDIQTRLKIWLRKNYGRSFWADFRSFVRRRQPIMQNSSKLPAVKMSAPLSMQLMGVAGGLMRDRVRLDDILWNDIAKRYFTHHEANIIYTKALTSSVARYEYLDKLTDP